MEKFIKHPAFTLFITLIGPSVTVIITKSIIISLLVLFCCISCFLGYMLFRVRNNTRKLKTIISKEDIITSGLGAVNDCTLDYLKILVVAGNEALVELSNGTGKGYTSILKKVQEDYFDRFLTHLTLVTHRYFTLCDYHESIHISIEGTFSGKAQPTSTEEELMTYTQARSSNFPKDRFCNFPCPIKDNYDFHQLFLMYKRKQQYMPWVGSNLHKLKGYYCSEPDYERKYNAVMDFPLFAPGIIDKHGTRKLELFGVLVFDTLKTDKYKDSFIVFKEEHGSIFMPFAQSLSLFTTAIHGYYSLGEEIINKKIELGNNTDSFCRLNGFSNE